MNKKYIITIITLLILAIITTLFSINKRKEYKESEAEKNITVNNEITNNSSTTNTIDVKSYSLEEIALHDKKEDCWLAIDGKVIDATKFIAEGKHPNDKILNGCGKEATNMFKSVSKHKGPSAQDALRQYEIGVLK